MTAPSPTQLANVPPTWDIKTNGSALDSSIQVLSIDVWTGVNRLPRARLVITDGSAADETFPISETAALIPGATLTIALGYGSTQTQIFSGVIQRHGLEANVNSPSLLVVEATDKAMAMTLARNNAVFQKTTDSALCTKLIGNVSGLTPKVSSTSVEHEAIVQYYATDWDLMVMRAEASGMVVMVADATVTVAAPQTSTSPVLTLTWGQSILDFKGEIDAATQLKAGAIKSFAWDPGTQKLLQSSAPSSSVSTPGNLSSSTLAGVFDVASYYQQSSGALIDSELADWSSAELLKSELAKLRGEVRFSGSALAVTGCMVTLAGLGARFNGDAWVSGVHHQLAEGWWRTTCELGLAPGWFAASAAQITAPGASGQLPPANNIMVGTVKQIHADPDGEFRVLVTLPLLQATDGVWARFGSYYASNKVGSDFYPEIGDEVIVAFLSGDPRYPVILGSLYSKANPPPYTPDDKNSIKSLWTKSGMHIDFVETDPSILITTPKKQSIKIDDKNKNIVVTDVTGNTITMSESGIKIDSPKDITISATGSISMSAGTSFDIKAGTSLSTKASTSTQVNCDGPIQIKGITVALNP
ncbi:MAG: Rhs element Vgr protein [Sphingomonas bacterium]|uniref:type VI secretion system tip protein VgrG n=1 Tax=Sphingomonas bacterium TaxID=1895847 RepID=UPI00260B0968|nr:type VI secretion system tip protein VgrG [Sphingomonas bacterium]MDB5710423.1 Rhs element Vgr protein [Sphingomonas bacterium]